MDRITHQPPRQQGYGSTSSFKNNSLKHTRKHERRREKLNQGAKLPGTGRPSGQEGRTVWLRTADCPHGYGGPSGLGRGLSVKANRTSSSEPRKTDRPRGARGLSARHPRTIRAAAADCLKPLPTKARNQNGSKAKPSKNTKNTRRTLPARTVRHHLADCPPYTDRPRNSPTPKVNTSNPSPDLPNGRSC
jgi:hypothetical protein